jgi:hypothetical protein
MTEQNLTPDPDDTEGHVVAAKADDADDTEGHKRYRDDDTDDTDDTEGHRKF